MKFNDQYRFVRQNMKKNKTRLFMTVLATAMGCAFLIVLASVGFGLQSSIINNVVGDRMVTAIDIYGKATSDGADRRMNDQDISYLNGVANVKAITYRNSLQQTLSPKVAGEDVHNDATIVVDYEAEKKAGFKLFAGKLPANKDEVVVGYNIRDNVNSSGESNTAPDVKEWIGQQMELEVQQYNEAGELQLTPLTVTIVGITEKPSREWRLDKSVYIGSGLLDEIEAITGTRLGALWYPAESGQQRQEIWPEYELSAPRTYNEVQVIADKANHVKAISEEIRDRGYMNHSIADELSQINLVFLIMKIGLIFVGTIAVLIASIGIFNTMTMAVTERSQDIGIMKAIGAHPSTIRRIFLLESSIIGILGAIIGTIVSYMISFLVNIGLPIIIENFMNEKIPNDFKFSLIPPYLALLACVISLGVALLSGSRPAKRATRIDVLSALRRDI
ncbi:MAG: FtsX-like permease family protein [Candidatus Cohnella colombiensis]|uniref:FtsX-like permease family protein n=1 Tax=Candidatus Cohnella colombiensis TaxID=3121368 RepID=A0AA95F100_9BACL|nr:MAG: FtsX-like permease family protein [Cohnella sp.]